MDEQILKTLENIEKLLKSSMSSTAGRLPNSAGRADSVKKDKSDKDSQKTFTAIAKSSKDTNDALLGLNKSLISLNNQVGKTSTGFGSLQVQMMKFTNSLAQGGASGGNQPSPGSAPDTGSGMLNSVLGAIRSKFNAILPSKTKTDGSAQVLSSAGLKAASAAVGASQLPKGNATADQAAKIMERVGAGVDKGIAPIAGSAAKATTPFGMMLGDFVDKFSKAGTSATALTGVFNGLVDIGVRLTSDFLQLSRIGLGSAGNLGELYISAAKAGMSLKEYTDMLDANISVASRQGSLDQFDKLISSADKQLAVMGIFGGESRVLQANLAQAGTMMGVNQADLAASSSNIIKTFDDLRSTVNMTAGEFSSMVTQLSKNEQVQRELVGIATMARAIRMSELVQIQSTGRRLGMTAEASDALGKALIAQRAATVEESLDARGALISAGAFLGMGDQGIRAGDLQLNNKKTPQETLELLKIQGEMDKRLQEINQSSNLGLRMVGDNFQAAFGKAGLKGIMDANRGAVLAQESGPAGVNKDFGKHVGSFGQFVGQLTTWYQGFSSSIGPVVASVIGGGLLAVFKGPIVGVLKSAIGKVGIGGAAVQGAGIAEGVAGAAQGAQAGTAGTSAKSMFKSFYQTNGALKTAAAEAAETSKISVSAASAAVADGEPVIKAIATSGSMFGEAFASFGGFFMTSLRMLSRILGPEAVAAIGAIVEVFTGDIADVLNPSGGFFNRFMGVIQGALMAFPNMIGDIVGYVFGDSWGNMIKNMSDRVLLLAGAGVRILLNSFLSPLVDNLKWILPKDSGLVKTLEGWSNGLQSGIDENFAVVQKLNADKNATIASLGKDAVAAANKTTKATVAATDRQTDAQAKFNNVAYGVQSAAEIAADGRALVGIPQVQTPAMIAPPAPVNTAAAPTTDAVKDTAVLAAGTGTNADMMVTLNAMLQVMRDSLAVESRQSVNSDTLLRLLRPGAVFADSEQITNKLLQQGYQA